VEKREAENKERFGGRGIKIKVGNLVTTNGPAGFACWDATNVYLGPPPTSNKLLLATTFCRRRTHSRACFQVLVGGQVALVFALVFAPNSSSSS